LLPFIIYKGGGIVISTAHYTIVAVYDGVNGADGRSVTAVTEYYLASASSSGVTTGTSGWTTAVQTITSTNKYLWNYEKVDYSDGSSTMTNPVIIGAYGNTGNTGPAGKSISSVTEYYLATSASSGVTTSTTGWTTTMQTTDNTKKYLWNYEVITYSDSTTTTIAPVIIGIQGDVGPTGPQGNTGSTGATGKGISSVTEYYLVNSSSTGITTATAGWSTTVPTLTSTNRYLWNYRRVTYTDSTTSDTTPLVIGVYGDTGPQGSAGATGKGITSITDYFLATSASSGVTTATAGWTTTVQSISSTNKYLWNYEKITYSDGSNTTTSPTIIGAYGDTGAQGPQGNTGATGPTGATGKGISSVTEYYLASTASTGVTTTTSGWSTTVPTMTSTNRYLWNYEVITYTDNSTATIAPALIGVYGDTGPQGSTGATGKGISSVTEYYLATSASSGVTTATTGWTTTVQSITSTNKYLWNYEKITYTDSSTSTTTPVIIGAYGDTGPQGIQGPTGAAGTSQYVHIRYSANADGSGFTTTPQSNTAYIGIANTTSSTAPALNTGYTWSNYKGPQGSQGIQGPAGTNGVTTYTWVKYADDVYGGNMSDTPSGKRYIGLAFNKTTATETTNASDYQWSPLYDNVNVGGRNIIQNSKEVKVWYCGYGATPADSVISTDINAYVNNIMIEKVYTAKHTTGNTGDFRLSFDTTNNDANISVSPLNGRTFTFSAFVKSDVAVTITMYVTNRADGDTTSKAFTLAANVWTLITMQKTFTSEPASPGIRIRMTMASTSNVSMCLAKLEEGNIDTDWSPAPEDIDAQLNYKASTDDLNNLGQIVADMNSVVNSKAGQGDLDAMVNAFNARVDQDIQDKQALSDSLNTLEGRTTLVETIANNSKIVTDFVNTVITESNEGIFIANGASSTGILIASNRISFMDGDIEVAYISNQTMQINHGIFVQSATIANFKFEALPSAPTILAVQWVGG
jgi:hypothetical protein